MRWLLCLLLLFPSVVIGEVSWIDRFALYTGCQPVGLIIEELPDDAANIGLTKQRMQTAVESRLRGAKIYEEKEESVNPDWAYLYVRVGVARQVFIHSVLNNAA